MRKLSFLVRLIVFVTFPLATVQACGPDFFPDVFVQRIHPDDPKQFAAGKLGVLLPTYPRADLAVAYRYLNGGSLASEEQKGYHPTLSLADDVEGDDAGDSSDASSEASGTDAAESSGESDLWLKARNRYAPPQPEIHTVRDYGMVYSAGDILAGNYENCQADGFHTAAVTLESRAKTWGAHSPELADWIKGQDAVFSNCGSSVPGDPSNKVITPSSPGAPPASAPQLLRHDRAYQIAAAQFYAAQFEPARASFQSIAQDASSPWRGIARYMVARTLIRFAFLSLANSSEEGSMAKFDPAMMQQAQQQLEAMQKDQVPGVSQHAIEDLLHLVRIRTEPQVRLAELSAALAGPNSDPYYVHDIADLTWYLNAKLDSIPIRQDASISGCTLQDAKIDFRSVPLEQKQSCFEDAYKSVADLRAISPLVDWLITFQSPSEAAKQHAFAQWKRTPSVMWLTAAMMKASSSDSVTPALIQATEHIPSTSPAWPTLEYGRLRLLIASGHATEARAELAAALPRIQVMGSQSAVNLFTGLRMRTAPSLNEALADAPRKVIEHISEEQASIDECLDVMKNPRRIYDCKKDTSPVEFSSDSAAVLNNETPLSLLVQAAQSDALSPQLRQAVAMVTWVRAVLLKNQPVAAQMLPLLPAKVQQQSGPGVGFRPLMTILRNPGLRPYLDDGVQRSYSYDFVESFSDNWWCGDWTTSFDEDNQPIGIEPVAFLTPQELKSAENETKSLLALSSASEYLGAQVVSYANAHPSDPDVPEALYLTLRMIRYGCNRPSEWRDPNKPAQADPVASIANEVGAIMRRRYPTNPWTKKAAPYVWLGKKNDE